MPRKTKAQKMAAQLRRLKQTVSFEGDKISLEAIDFEPTKEPNPSAQKAEPKSGTSPDYSYVYRDLRRIFVISLSLIVLEVLLSLTASSQYAKLLLRTLNLDF